MKKAISFDIHDATNKFITAHGKIQLKSKRGRQMSLHLFIDTNVYLSFYHFSSDDINSIKNLANRVEANDIILHLPQQVENEWERNRETKLSNAALEFQKAHFQTQVPRHMHDLQMAQTYMVAVAEAKKARDHLIAEANVKSRTYSLQVDILLRQLFEASTRHIENDEIYARGKVRAEKGNPPGKSGSVGDQYNWEMLLANVPDADLYILTKDGDYVSPLGGKDETGIAYAHPYLKREWSTRKNNSNLYIFESIKALLSHYNNTIAVAAAPIAPQVERAEQQQIVEPELPGQEANAIHLANEPEPAPVIIAADAALSPIDRATKNEAIETLINSTNFQTTHNAVANLAPWMDFFTKADADRLAEAAIENNQIGWVITDNDVNQFYLHLLSKHFVKFNPVNLDNLILLLDLNPDEPSE